MDRVWQISASDTGVTPSNKELKARMGNKQMNFMSRNRSLLAKTMISQSATRWYNGVLWRPDLAAPEEIPLTYHHPICSWLSNVFSFRVQLPTCTTRLCTSRPSLWLMLQLCPVSLHQRITQTVPRQWQLVFILPRHRAFLSAPFLSPHFSAWRLLTSRACE